jgi:hypothetical protein
VGLVTLRALLRTAGNACCIMRPRGQKSYCLWGFGPNEPYLPGLGISYTTDIDSGNFTQVPWKVAPGVFSPLGNQSMAFLPLGESYNELGLEASARPVALSNGHWLHFYASHTCGFGWNPRHSAACGGPAGNFTGNYTVGWVVLNGSDPTEILARWNGKRPWMNPVHDYETLCKADLSGRCKWKGANPWTLFMPSADPVPGTKDTFRVFWGAGDGNTGTGIVRVTVPTHTVTVKTEVSPTPTSTAASPNAGSSARTKDWSCVDPQRQWERNKDHGADRAEVIRFAQAMAVEHWYDGNRLWLNESRSVCDWEGICCEVALDGWSRVTELHVERNGLNGSFPSTFRTLSRLKVLDVHLNNVTNFPPGVEALVHLQQAKFGRNPICGMVPVGFAALTNLTKFNCNFCCKSDVCPPSLPLYTCLFPHLPDFPPERAGLSGEFPDILGNKPKLEELYWDGNNFTGPIPPSVSSLKKLTKLSFNLNSMSGLIPPGLAKLPLDDCRIGSDTDFKPYDTSVGSPERAWLLHWIGNLFDCPVPRAILKSACNAQGKGYTPSPVNCSRRVV